MDDICENVRWKLYYFSEANRSLLFIVLIIFFAFASLNRHLLLSLLVVLKQDLMQFLFIDVKLGHHMLVTFALAHHLLFVALVIIFVADHVTLVLHLTFLQLFFFLFNLLFHTFDAFVFNLDFFALFFFLFTLHGILIDLVHLLLLSLDSLCNGCLLLRVELVEVLQLLLGHLSISSFVVLFIILFASWCLNDTIIFRHRILFFTVHFFLFVDIFLNLIWGTLHLLDAFLASIHCVGLIHWTTFVHLSQGLTSILLREVSSCHV